MCPEDDDCDDKDGADNNITLYSLPLIAEHFTHIILFVLDDTVC